MVTPGRLSRWVPSNFALLLYAIGQLISSKVITMPTLAQEKTTRPSASYTLQMEWRRAAMKSES
jgi:hypothetical protein